MRSGCGDGSIAKPSTSREAMHLLKSMVLFDDTRGLKLFEFLSAVCVVCI